MSTASSIRIRLIADQVADAVETEFRGSSRFIDLDATLATYAETQELSGAEIQYVVEEAVDMLWILANEASIILNENELCRSNPNYDTIIRKTLRSKTKATHRSQNCVESQTPHAEGYEVGRKLGQGGMGVVFEAIHIQTQRRVAVKFLNRNLFQSGLDQSLVRFRKEIQALVQLEHSNCATVYETKLDALQPFYTMRLIDGDTLAQKLRVNAVAPVVAARYLVGAAMGVGYAHRKGIIHRDLKPQNILIDESTDSAIVADFGLAKVRQLDETVETASGTVLGTPAYMAPEQATNATSAGQAADIYSLGATLYHAITGRPPFQTASFAETLKQLAEKEPLSPRQLNAEVPAELEYICLKCLEKSPHDRYASCEELAEDLSNYLKAKPTKARPPTIAGRVLKWCRRNPTATTSVASIIALLVVLLGVSVTSASRLRRERDNVNRAFGYFSDVISKASSLEDGPDVKVADALRSAVGVIDRDFPMDNEMKSDVQFVFGKNLFQLGDYETAKKLIEQSNRIRRNILGVQHPKTQETLMFLPDLYLALREEQNIVRLLEMHSTNGSLDSDGGLIAQNAFGVVRAYQDDRSHVGNVILSAQRLINRNLINQHVVHCILRAAEFSDDAGDFLAADRFYREAEQLNQRADGTQHRNTLYVKQRYANSLHSQGKLVEAMSLSDSNFELAVKNLGIRDEYTIALGVTKSCIQDSAGMFEQALATLETLERKVPYEKLDNNRFAGFRWTKAQPLASSFRLRRALELLREYRLRYYEESAESISTTYQLLLDLVEAEMFFGDFESAAAHLGEANALLEDRVEQDSTEHLIDWDALRLRRLALANFLDVLAGTTQSLSKIDSTIEAFDLDDLGFLRQHRDFIYLSGQAFVEAKQYSKAADCLQKAISASERIDMAPWCRLNMQRDLAWSWFQLAGMKEDASQLLQETIQEYESLMELGKTDGTHPQYLLSKLYLDSINGNIDVRATVKALEDQLGPNSPLLNRALAQK